MIVRAVRPTGRWRVDPLVVGALAVLVAIGTANVGVEPTERAVDELAIACGVGAAAALLGWRRWPVPVAGLVAVALAVYIGRRYPPGPALLPGPLAITAVGYTVATRTAWIAAAAFSGVVAVGVIVAGQDDRLHGLAFIGWSIAGTLAGQALAARRERAAADRERAALARERAVADERLRIAQDVHDSVAHALATINVQSGVAGHLLAREPGRAATALEAIRLASRDALTELGSILATMRSDGSEVPRTPLATIGDIATLVARAREDGLSVRYAETGPPGSVGAGAGIAAYRVVQEALTNVRRHGGAGVAAEVTVERSAHGALRVRVCDDGGTAPVERADHRPGGFGLAGMRERVEASGGTLRVSPTKPRGFVVDAEWFGQAAR